jgi:amino acid adenylation domain-containing protein
MKLPDNTMPAERIPSGRIARPPLGSHALRIRLEQRRDANRIAAQLAALSVPCWMENFACTAESTTALKRRERELTWPESPSGVHGLRMTLLCYAEGRADLIIAARRALWSIGLLQRLACLLLEEAADDALAALLSDIEPAIEAHCLPVPEVLPDWARWGDATATGYAVHRGQALSQPWAPSIFLAAVGLLLARFDEDRPPALSVIDTSESRLPYFPQVGVEPGMSLRSYLAQLECPAESSASTAVGVVLDRLDTDAPVQLAEYRACLGQPWPLTISLETRTYAISLRYAFDCKCFDVQRVQYFADALEAAYASMTHLLAQDGICSLGDVAHTTPTQAQAIAVLGASVRHPLTLESEFTDERIAALAAIHPEAIALSYDDARINYGELDRLAARMARVLQTRAVGPGDRIGVCLERSLALVPTLLAVWKAGATYVPLDPAYPADRLAYTLTDAAPSLVITQDAATTFETPVAVLPIQELLALAANIDEPDLPPFPRSPGDAAYIIYTSGSTGRPKGVVVPHRNVTALIDATRDDMALSSKDVWTLFHSSAFDFSVWEIWGCLATGGKLVVVPYWTSRSVAEFAELLQRERVTILSQTPSAFAQLIEADRQLDACLAVRLVTFGGEALDSRMLLLWLDKYAESRCRLVNMFGITETTVHVTAETVTRNHALVHSRVVGRPIAGWHVYVMDAQQRLLPPGVAGEIYVGGAGVASLYLNREELTAERFLPDPYHAGRMYRSGDRGRLRADGRLEHLGRMDSQVKLRGFRIELDEIRAVLLECPGVTAAAVVLNRQVSDDAASARLDAYVVLAGANTSHVRKHAARLLPEHMLPSTVTALKALPLTANGKLDAKRLPAPSRGGFQTFDDHVKPTVALAGADGDTSLESLLCRVWSEVMGVEVGPEDNFFELGGNSLYAVRIASTLRETAKLSLPLRELYSHQTVRGVAAHLSAA